MAEELLRSQPVFKTKGQKDLERLDRVCLGNRRVILMEESF